MDKKREDVNRLMTALYGVDAVYEEFSRRMGYKANMMWLLYALNDGEPHSQKQICQDWFMTKTTLNTLVKECEAKGYLVFQSIPGKRREKHIILTDSGKEYAERVLEKIYRAEGIAIEQIEDIEGLNLQLERFLASLKSEFQEILLSEDSVQNEH